MSKCSNCGKELGSEATFCESCDSSVLVESAEVDFAVNDEPIVETYLDLEEKFGKLSDKWAWTMVCAEICCLLGIIGTFFLLVIDVLSNDASMLSVFIFVVLLVVLRIVFWRLDLNELKKKGYQFGGLGWFGLFLLPVYLFIRAAKTTKRYGYAIVYCVLLVVLPIGASFLPMVYIIIKDIGRNRHRGVDELVETTSVLKPAVQNGSFMDYRDGKIYRTINIELFKNYGGKPLKIGNQTWMAENLNYQTPRGSWCYENDTSNCGKYGRLYDWNTAMKVCPTGWHLSSSMEWYELGQTVGGKRERSDDGTVGWYGVSNKLKAKNGWNWNDDDNVSGDGTDEYGFSALPSGNRYLDGRYGNLGNYGIWWTDKEYGSDYAYNRIMDNLFDVVYEGNNVKGFGSSVRCVQDEDDSGKIPAHENAGTDSNEYTSKRSRASIQRVVMKNMPEIRYVYTKRLRDKPGLTGKISVKFAIDEFGKVIFIQMVESTVNDPKLENLILNMVKKWTFEPIDKPGDVTAVTYPFVFSQ